MSTTFPNKKTVDWAVHTFRPLMHDLDIKNLESGVHQICTFDDSYYATMAKSHMDNCVIIVKRVKFSKQNSKGIFIWQYNEKTDLFALYILLNDSLYTSIAQGAKEIRKLVSTHEFTHCVAALLSISELETKQLITNQQSKMKKSFHALQDNDIPKLQRDIIISMYARTPSVKSLLSFPDPHFRTGDEDFQGSYEDLYSQLLFSYELFRKAYFKNSELEQYYKIWKEDKKKANEYLSSISQKISNEKCLPKNFVNLRIRDFFLPQALYETIKTN